MATVVYAWNLLDSERQISIGPTAVIVGAIPYRAVTSWCDRQPWIDEDITTEIVEAISRLDADRARRDAAKRDAKTNKHPRSKRP